MKKQLIKTSLRVVGLFGCAMLMSFIPDYFHSFFGDWKCEGCDWVYDPSRPMGGYYTGCDYGMQNKHIAQYHWGYRHWLFFAMGLVLFIIQVYDMLNTTSEN